MVRITEGSKGSKSEKYELYMRRLIVLLVSWSILTVEVFFTRLFSVQLWANTAFAVLSIAMLGIGTSGLVAYLWPRLFEKNEDKLITGLLISLSASIMISGILLLRFVPPPGALYRYLWVALIALLPFFVGGLLLTLIFSFHQDKISRLYAFDLCGASLGAILTLPAISLFNGPPLLYLPAALLLFAALIDSLLRKQKLMSGLAVAGFVLLGGAGLSGLKLEVTKPKGELEKNVEIQRWGPEARITVEAFDEATRWIRIDSGVVTPVLRFSGDLRELDFLKHNVLQLAYQIRPFQDAVIIGSGGGSDLLAALEAGVPHIDAVEVNRTIIRLMQEEPLLGFSGNLYKRPEISVYLEDGRAFIGRLDHQVDLIQATFVDTHNAAASGSHTLSESYLYTVEAIHQYLDHLRPGGVVSLSRWCGQHYSNYAETARLVAVIQRALEERGVEKPEDHLLVVRGAPRNRTFSGPGYQNPEGEMWSMATILLKNEAFEVAEIQKIREFSTKNDFRPLWLPGMHSPDPLISRLLRSRGAESFFQGVMHEDALDISPTTDNRPFFFSFFKPDTYFEQLRSPHWNHAEKHWSAIGIGNLWQVFMVTLLLVLLFFFLPLGLQGKRLEKTPATFLALGYFIFLGLGFIGIEIGMIQRFSLFLQHPTYALIVVLAGLLFFSGIGSLWTSRIDASGAAQMATRTGAFLGAFLVVGGLSFGPLLRLMTVQALWLKIPIALGLIFPLAFLMGTLFPLGVKAMGLRQASLFPWAWGLNGAASVFGSVLSMFVAVSWGFSVAWWSFSICYFLAALSAWALSTQDLKRA